MTKERNYGIDLLRLVLMFMVCILHTLKQGGVLEACEAGSLTRVIRTRFKRADFPLCFVKILVNTKVFTAFLPCLTKNPLRSNSAT